MAKVRAGGGFHVSATAGPSISLQGISKRFGGVHALSDVSFDVTRRHVTALIGPNGAGKSTLLGIASGSFAPTDGRIFIGERDTTGRGPETFARNGVSRTFQLVRLFTTNDATVLDNVLLGAHRHVNPTLLDAFFRRRRMSAEMASWRAKAIETLAFVGLKDVHDMPPATLSFGNQRLVELARALLASPDVLLLDEPASGLNDAEVDRFLRLLAEIRDRGITILLVEHNMKVVMSIADRVVVLNFGRKLAEGRPTDIRTDSAVVEAYLGAKHARELTA